MDIVDIHFDLYTSNMSVKKLIMIISILYAPFA